MGPTYNAISTSQIPSTVWQKSQRSNPSGNCVEIARLPEGVIAMRNSRYPDGLALVYTVAEMDAFIRAIKDGDFDCLIA